MKAPVETRTFTEAPPDYGEILRYAGCPANADTTMVDECLAEARGKLRMQVCFRRFALVRKKDGLDLGFAETRSADLQKALRGCDGIIVFAATLGMELDRLIYRYSRLSPVKALLLQAIGAERIESLCNQFCAQLQNEGLCLNPRFSPGYGDLPLALQREIIAVLDCPRQIGVTLNESLLMSPSKSVTAIVGIRNTGE